VLAVASTILFAVWLARRLGLGPIKGVLAGGAVAICGASAALAIAAVLPKQKDSERFTLMVVVSVTVLSTVAMVLYPLLVRAFQMPPELGGLFIGGTIHDVAQVVGAGYTINQATGDVATIVKLFRVALLVVVVAAVALVFREQNAAQGAGGEVAGSAEWSTAPGSARVAAAQAATSFSGWRARFGLIPWFLWLFVAMVVLNSTLGLQGLAPVLGSASRACLVLAIAALGLKTSFMQLARMGWRPAALILAATLWLAGLVLVAIWWW
jgi:uncharacterized membrane protein YadS